MQWRFWLSGTSSEVWKVLFWLLWHLVVYQVKQFNTFNLFLNWFFVPLWFHPSVCVTLCVCASSNGLYIILNICFFDFTTYFRLRLLTQGKTWLFFPLKIIIVDIFNFFICVYSFLQKLIVDFFIDLHAHSTLMNGFMYGNTYDDIDRYERQSVFPKLLCANAEDFSLANTNFNRDAVKAGTGRRYRYV